MRSQTSSIRTKALFADALLACKILCVFSQWLVCFAFSRRIALVKQLVYHQFRLDKSTPSVFGCEVPVFSQL